MKPFNLEKALAGDPVICKWKNSAPQKVVEITFLKLADSVAFITDSNLKVVWACDSNGFRDGCHILFMAPKPTTLWSVRATQRGTQSTQRVQGYWQSNLLVGEDGKAALLHLYDHRITRGEMTLHSIEIEE